MVVEDDSAPVRQERVVAAIIPDVFFSVTVRNTIRRLGFDVLLLRSISALDAGSLGDALRLLIVDATALRAQEDWQTVAALRANDLPVLAFGPHKDVETLRRAQAAGVSRVVANSLFHREMPVLIERYAR